MAFSDKTLERMRWRIRDLIAHFDESLTAFETRTLFTGPSVYFHRKTRRMLSTGSVAECLENESFLESLYATLTAWGLHRMGPGGAKLVDFSTMADSFRRQKPHIVALTSMRIDTLAEDQIRPMASCIWKVIEGLRVSNTEAKIVAGTKALHHVLPDLVPPIDREYTLRFFLHVTTLQSENHRAAFDLLYPAFQEISVTQKHVIRGALQNNAGWNTSVTKVIDNAIVGYVLNHPGL